MKFEVYAQRAHRLFKEGAALRSSDDKNDLLRTLFSCWLDDWLADLVRNHDRIQRTFMDFMVWNMISAAAALKSLKSLDGRLKDIQHVQLSLCMELKSSNSSCSSLENKNCRILVAVVDDGLLMSTYLIPLGVCFQSWSVLKVPCRIQLLKTAWAGKTAMADPLTGLLQKKKQTVRISGVLGGQTRTKRNQTEGKLLLSRKVII